MVQIPSCCGCDIGWELQLQTPSPGISICYAFSYKKKKKKEEKNKYDYFILPVRQWKLNNVSRATQKNEDLHANSMSPSPESLPSLYAALESYLKILVLQKGGCREQRWAGRGFLMFWRSSRISHIFLYQKVKCVVVEPQHVPKIPYFLDYSALGNKARW